METVKLMWIFNGRSASLYMATVFEEAATSAGANRATGYQTTSVDLTWARSSNGQPGNNMKTTSNVTVLAVRIPVHWGMGVVSTRLTFFKALSALQSFSSLYLMNKIIMYNHYKFYRVMS